uniref:HAT C-terminal dimerisation domain-containing protein n=1 Tax=Panagrolaimus davidi TaxID=227884 RepID=A0A914QW49_9BILA
MHKNILIPMTVIKPFHEPKREPGIIAMDHLASVFSAPTDVKVDATAAAVPLPFSNNDDDISDAEEDSTIRFTSQRKLEIQQLIDQHKCIITPKKDPKMNKIVKDDTVLAYQCSLCLTLFSPVTTSHLRKHLRKCQNKPQNQQTYVINKEEREQMNLLLAELSAIDGGRLVSITETESFKKFISYIGNMCFKVGRDSAIFSVPPNFLSSNNEVSATLVAEVDGLVTKFQAFLQRRSDLHFTILLDFTSLRYNAIGISIHFLYEWEFKTVLLGVYNYEEVASSSNIKTLITNVKKRYGLLFESNFIVTDENSVFAGDNGGLDYTVDICKILKTIVNRTTNPQKESKRNQIMIELDNDVLAQVTTIKECINDLKKVLTSEALAAVLGLIKSRNIFESYNIIISPFYHKLLLLDKKNSAATINHVLIAYYELEDHLKKFIISDKPLLKALSISALAILQHQVSHFTQPIHYAACTIDIFQRGKIYQLRGPVEVQKARAETEALFIKYIQQNIVINDPPRSASDMTSYLMDPNDVQELNNHELFDGAKIELSKYYRYLPSSFDIQQENIVKFWKARENTFPYLRKFANYVLSIPATSDSISITLPELSNRISKEDDSINASTVLSNFSVYKSIKTFFGLS